MDLISQLCLETAQDMANDVYLPLAVQYSEIKT